MLTYNAPTYVAHAITSVREQTVGVDYELVVVDNLSESPTRELVTELERSGAIDTLKLMDHNSLFAGGNNMAATLADPKATHFLLLNSDIEARDPHWLSRLLSVHQRGITSYGMAPDPMRCDGYCLLIDADLYRANPLDETYQWFWGVTKQQAALLRQGFSVQGYSEHEKWLHHFGGKSGSAWRTATKVDLTRAEVSDWFDGKSAVVLDDFAAVGLTGRLAQAWRRQRNRTVSLDGK
jgi:glycosyltransferase involved in cell wall biosynthesis